MSPTTESLPLAPEEARSAAAIEAQVAFEQVQLLYAVSPSRMLAGLVFALVLAWVLWPAGPALPAWAAAMTALSLWRAGEGARFRRGPDHRRRCAAWRRRYIAWMLPYALAWAALLPLFGSTGDALLLTLMLSGILGIASVGVFTTFSLAATSLWFLATLLGPVVAWLALQGAPATWGLAVGVTMYGTVLSLEALRGQRRQNEMIRLRLENAAIAEERSRALLLAEQGSRTKSRFLAAVSHEMRTPLNGIMGLAESLRDRATDGAQRHEAGVLLATAQHLHGVIGDLLDLSRLEFGRLRLEPVPFDPARLLHEVAALHARVAADKGVRLRVDAPATLPARLGDTLRVQQVLHNLLGNAVKFTHEGEIEVGLVAGGDRLRYNVRDTGPGVPAAQAEAIFEPFEQAAPVQPHQGTGLGLTIARRLARAMDGDVQCRSAQPRGAVFSFTLRAPPAPAGTTAPPAAAGEPPLQGHVLVVDDNAVNALVAQTMLTRLGLSSETARDGEEALALMADTRFDLVLMDCRMPRLDGLEATRRWRATEAAPPRLPIIGVTANVSAEDRRQCLASGMDGFLGKPFLLEDLRTQLLPHLQAAGALAQNPGA